MSGNARKTSDTIGVSVILPFAGNPAARLTLNSLARQTLAPNSWELILVREHGSDSNPIRAISTLICRTQILEYSRPFGFVGHTAGIMRNMGSRRAIGRILVFLDSDAIVSPTCLQEHYNLHQTFGSPNLVVCGMWPELPANQFSILQSSWDFDRLLGMSTPDFRSGPARLGTWEDFYSGNVSLTKALFESARMFDEAGFRCHDMDLAYRMSLGGALFRISPECSAIHIEHPRSIRARQQQIDGWINLSRKCPEIRDIATDRAKTLTRSLHQIERKCQRRFRKITSGLRGKTRAKVWYPNARSTQGLWRRIQAVPACLTIRPDGVRCFLRLHRNCWDYSIHLNSPPQAPTPRISVVIPTLNRAEHLRECLLSVLCQTLQDFELIVIDDGSTDESCATLSEFAYDPRLRVLLNPGNFGLAYCLNKGLETVRSPIIVHLDSDDTLHPHALARLLEPFKTANVGAVFGCPTRDRTHKVPRTPEEFVSSLDTHAPRAYRACILRQIGGWLTDDPDEGRFFEDRLTLARVRQVSQVHPLPGRLCSVRQTEDSLTRANPQKAMSAKFAIVTNYANVHHRMVSFAQVGRNIAPHFSERLQPSRKNSWSVVIPHRDRWHLLDYTLRSWLQSDLLDRDSEILVVDDGSQTQPQFSPLHTRISIVRLPQSKGSAFARNIGAKHARNDFLFFCDADHVVPPDVIAQHELAHERLANDGVVLGDVLGRRAASRFRPLDIPPEILRRVYNLARFDQQLFDRLLTAVLKNQTLEIIPPETANLFRELSKYSFSDHALAGWGNILLTHGNGVRNFAHRWIRVCSGSLSISKAAFDALHGFDPSMPSMEDWEFGARLQKRGFRVACAPCAEPLHLIHPRDEARNANNHRAISRFMAKHPDLIRSLLDDDSASRIPGYPVIQSLLSKRNNQNTRTHEPNTSNSSRCERIDNLVFLTFDDGPDPVGTNCILEVLDKHSCKATFFVHGERAVAHPHLCQQIALRDNEFGIHGWDHTPAADLSKGQITTSFSATMRALRSITKIRACWARPTYGMVTRNYTAAVRQLKLKHVGWDISARDWCCPTRFEFIAKVAMSNPAGKIILMHDGSGDALTTAQSLDYLIPKMKDAGLRFGTLCSHPGLSFNPHSQYL